MLRSTAVFSPCRVYRYTLRRVWDEALPSVVFVGLNPSTADETLDDPTVRRCIGFARDWGFGTCVVTNIFAFRSTDPRGLLEIDDPVGPRNNHWIRRECAAAALVVAAWGVHGTLHERGAAVLRIMPPPHSPPHCLGMTKEGFPRHPLYLSKATRVARMG